MENSGKQEKKNEFTEVKIFPVPLALGEIKTNITINTNSPSKPSKDQIINQAIQFHQKGNIPEASKCYQELISQGCNDHRVFCNYGVILKNLSKLQEAEMLYRKAIKIKPDYADAHYNLGNTLKDLGKLKEAELPYRNAIEIKPDYADAHYNLGIILKNLFKLEEAELSYRKAIKIKPDYADAHYNLGNTLKDLGKLKEAELSYRKVIKIKYDSPKAHSNLGNILNDLGKLEEAEASYRKAIEIKPDLASPHSNLGGILICLGKLKEGELSLRKAIDLKPDLAKAYYSLSLIKYSDQNTRWQDQLFSENILIDQSQKDKVDIYFARANIFHKEKNYRESSIYLQLANNININLKPSKIDTDTLINKSKELLIESDKKEITKKDKRNFSKSIFIVGMPRSGTTLLESILSMSKDVYDLGEINILEESFQEYMQFIEDMNLAELYEEKVNNKTELNITTNKWLYNYQYAGIISRHMPSAKIIHCFRHPLDNILSIYRTYFARGNSYSSSLVDCARVYLDQNEIMTEYKNRYRSKIYDLNYDSLVSNPNKEIKSLISWLGWKWEDTYLSPHLNPRSISTASNVQVRSPINSKSIGGWKNYKEMLKPAIEILTKTTKYRDLIA